MKNNLRGAGKRDSSKIDDERLRSCGSLDIMSRAEPTKGRGPTFLNYVTDRYAKSL